MGQHQWWPQDPRRVPSRRHRRRRRPGHPAAVRAVDRYRHHHRGHQQPRGRDQPPRLRAGRGAGRRGEVPGGPQGQEDRLLPRPGAGGTGAAGAGQGRTDPGRRRARRDPERRRRLRQRPRQQAGRRGPARRHPADVVPREVRQRRRHIHPHGHPRRPEPALRARRDHQGRRHGGRAGQVRRGVGQGQAVDQRAPRGVRPGVLRRPRGADPRGRPQADRADRADRGPTNWDETIAAHQATADLLSREQGQPELDVAGLYDRRYEKVIADALGAGS